MEALPEQALSIIDLSQADPGFYDLTDSEGFVWFLAREIVEYFELYPKARLSLEDLMQAAVANSFLLARRLLTSQIVKKPKPIPVLREGLKANLIGEVDIELNIWLAEERGLIDDQRWAKSLVEIRYEQKKEGPLALRDWLRRRGFDKTSLEAALTHYETIADQLETALDLLATRFRQEKPSPKAHQAAWAFLARKGYRSDLIGKALRRFFGGLDPDDW